MSIDQQRIDRRECLVRAAAFVGALSVTPRLSWAQSTRGFVQTAQATSSRAELNRQRDLWVLEVQLKSMRMTWIDSESAKSGREQVWYLAYRAINRPLESLQSDDTEPVNQLDVVPEKPIFLPEFTLVTFKDPARKVRGEVIQDSVIPQAVAAINQVEAHRPGEQILKDTVSVVQTVPDPVPADQDGEWIYGVATWTGIDPDTDFFRVILDGFTNGYELRKEANGTEQLYRRVLVQDFTRLGDRFDPNQREFDFSGPLRWEYLPATELKPAGSTASIAPTRRR